MPVRALTPEASVSTNFTTRAHKTKNQLPRIGLEPTHLTAPEPKSGVSTNFTTWADGGTILPYHDNSGQSLV